MVANINWVTDLLATGGDLSYNDEIAAKQVASILEQDIALVIDLRKEADDADVWAELGMDYLHLPTDDAFGHSIPSSLFNELVDTALPYLNKGEKVLVHCHMGINRGPSGALAVLLAQGMEARQAFDLIRSKRPEAYIAYAKDALRAHLEREARDRFGEDPKDMAKRHALTMRLFADHLREKNTPEVEANIQHIIRSNHKRDNDEWMMTLSKKR